MMSGGCACASCGRAVLAILMDYLSIPVAVRWPSATCFGSLACRCMDDEAVERRHFYFMRLTARWFGAVSARRAGRGLCVAKAPFTPKAPPPCGAPRFPRSVASLWSRSTRSALVPGDGGIVCQSDGCVTCIEFKIVARLFLQQPVVMPPKSPEASRASQLGAGIRRGLFEPRRGEFRSRRVWREAQGTRRAGCWGRLGGEGGIGEAIPPSRGGTETRLQNNARSAKKRKPPCGGKPGWRRKAAYPGYACFITAIRLCEN
ncbi:MAG: hypothetical protein H6R07_1698 [Proteobacteria bacterium]|nr:hypothetical protein [Pseudomonadota bacterium]